MLGAGGMARTFLRAFCAVRDIRYVKVYSPTKANREAFAKEMSENLGIEVVPVDSAREAVRGVDILSTNTDSMVPTFEAGWVEPGMHVTMLGPFEISPEVERRFDVSIRQGVGGLGANARAVVPQNRVQHPVDQLEREPVRDGPLDELDVAHVVATQIDVHQPGDGRRRVGVAVVVHALDERRGAVADADERDSHLLRLVAPGAVPLGRAVAPGVAPLLDHE
jgi:hypothetical protein